MIPFITCSVYNSDGQTKSVPNKLTGSSDKAAEFKSEGAGFECRLVRQFPPPVFPCFLQPYYIKIILNWPMISYEK